MMGWAFTIVNFLLCSPQVEAIVTGKHTSISTVINSCHIVTTVVWENKVILTRWKRKVSNLFSACRLCRWWVSAVQLVEGGHLPLPHSDHLAPLWRCRWRGMVMQRCRSLLQSFSSLFRNWVRNWCRWSKFFLQKLFSSPGIASQGWWSLFLLCGRKSCLPPGVQGEGEVGPNLQGEGEGQRLASQHLAKVQTLGRKKSIFFHRRCSHFCSLFLNQKYLVGEPKNMLPDTFTLSRRPSCDLLWHSSPAVITFVYRDSRCRYHNLKMATYSWPQMLWCRDWFCLMT